MTIPPSHLQERLSVAYVMTVTAKAGAVYYSPNGHEYGTDGIIEQQQLLENGNYSPSGWPLRCQIKSSINCEMSEDHITYDIDVIAYNKLVDDEVSPSILILLRLPKDEKDWVYLDETCLKLRDCCYWLYLKGLPSKNLYSVRIYIPRKNQFTPEALLNLMNTMRCTKGILDEYISIQ